MRRRLRRSRGAYRSRARLSLSSSLERSGGSLELQIQRHRASPGHIRLRVRSVVGPNLLPGLRQGNEPLICCLNGSQGLKEKYIWLLGFGGKVFFGKSCNLLQIDRIRYKTLVWCLVTILYMLMQLYFLYVKVNQLLTIMGTMFSLCLMLVRTCRLYFVSFNVYGLLLVFQYWFFVYIIFYHYIGVRLHPFYQMQDMWWEQL